MGMGQETGGSPEEGHQRTPGEEDVSKKETSQEHIKP